jgi:MYXO-CTERM domain-containing protein
MTRTRLLLTMLLAVSCFLTLTAAQADYLSSTVTSVPGGYKYTYALQDWTYSYGDGSGGPTGTSLWAIDVGTTIADITDVQASNSTDPVNSTSGLWVAATYDSATSPSALSGSGLDALSGDNVLVFYWNGESNVDYSETLVNPPWFSFITSRPSALSPYALSDGANPIDPTPHSSLADAPGEAPATVPEPGSLALGSLLLFALGAWRQRRTEERRH